MAGELWLADSNILIRWVQPQDPEFNLVQTSIRKIGQSGDAPCYTSQNLGEFWNVLTRPVNRNGYGLSPHEADVHAITLESRFRILPDGIQVHNEWRRLLVDHGVSGTQVHDARLAAAMHIHGVKRILTFNTKDFARFSDIEAVHPNQLIQHR